MGMERTMDLEQYEEGFAALMVESNKSRPDASSTKLIAPRLSSSSAILEPSQELSEQCTSGPTSQASRTFARSLHHYEGIKELSCCSCRWIST